MTPRTTAGQVFCMFYAFFGIPLTGLMLKSLGEKILDSIDSCFRAIDTRLMGREARSTNIRTSLLLFIIMTSMILVLAGLAVWYEGWSFFEGIYFAFITLSTIGFGDFVPSHPTLTSEDEPKEHFHVVLFVGITFVYITVGLSVVSSVLLSVTRSVENKTAWDFISLDNESDDEELVARQSCDANLSQYGGTRK